MSVKFASIRRILIVDDEPSVCQMVERLLEKFKGLEFRMALTGQDALLIADDFDPESEPTIPSFSSWDLIGRFDSSGLRDRNEHKRISYCPKPNLVRRSLQIGMFYEHTVRRYPSIQNPFTTRLPLTADTRFIVI